MLREDVYRLLEEKFPTYATLSSIDVQECKDLMVGLQDSEILVASFDLDMRSSSGEDIFVRSGVLGRLKRAQSWLDEFHAGVKLAVFYGWRDPEIQRESFEKIRRGHNLEGDDSPEALEIIHRSIAVPDVAGHPTGAAVDITLVDAFGKVVGMGTAPHDFSKDSYVGSPFISAEAWKQRHVLRSAMLSAGFAPFDGEWWHFSYGDREWANYYQRPHAIYAEQKIFP